MERQALSSAPAKGYGSAREASTRDEPRADAWAARDVSYRRLLAVHAGVGVPATIALLVACLCLARYGWHAHGGPEASLVELGIGAAAWLATEGLREPLFDLVIRLPTRALAPVPSLRWASVIVSGIGPIALHACSHEAVRLGAVALSASLHPPSPDDDASPFESFTRSLYIAIGWAAAECAVRAVRLLVHHVPLYREVRRRCSATLIA